MDGLAFMVIMLGIPIGGVVLFIILMSGGPSKESKAKARTAHEAKKSAEREARHPIKVTPPQEPKEDEMPIPSFGIEDLPYAQSPDGLWSCGWKEDEITGHQELVASGAGIDTDGQAMALRVRYTPGEDGGTWHMGVLYEGLSLRSKLVTLYLLIDGKRFQTRIEGAGSTKLKQASFFLMDPQLFRALLRSRVVKYTFADERGELHPGATSGFHQLGALLYSGDVREEVTASASLDLSIG